MGLNYSIKTLFNKKDLVNCINWINKNTWSINNDNNSFKFGDDRFNLRGDDFLINNSYVKNPFSKTLKLNDEVKFSTSLILKIDSVIVDSIGGFELHHNPNKLDNFIEDFKEYYLGDGKVRVGGFDTTLKFKNCQDIFELTLTAVTSDFSNMLVNSFSVKSWINELSTSSKSIMSLIDMEDEGQNIVFYYGSPINILIKEEIENHKNLDDFFKNYKLTL